MTLAGKAGQVIHRIVLGNIQQATTQPLASTRQAERAAQDQHTLAQLLQQAVAIYQV